MNVNKKLRQEIDVIRRERVSLYGIRENMDVQIKGVHDELLHLTQNYEKRGVLAVELQEKIVALKEKNEKEQEVYVTEYTVLQVCRKFDENVLERAPGGEKKSQRAGLKQQKRCRKT
jgi:hypothetical protein